MCVLKICNLCEDFELLSEWLRGVIYLLIILCYSCLLFSHDHLTSNSSYGHCCRQLATYRQVNLERLSGLDLFIAGAVTGAVQSPFRAVVDRVKSVMQVRESTPGKAPYRWSGACVLDLVRKDGLRVGLFQGFNSVLLREIPQFAIYYPSYEFLKHTMSSSEYFNPFFVQLLSGGIAGTVQWLPPFYCFDVIKSRMQTVPLGYYNSMSDCAVRLWREEGAMVFLRWVLQSWCRLLVMIMM